MAPITKQERVKESVQILKKLQELGVPPTDPGYTNTKAVLDTWIFDGKECKAEVEFPRAGRIAHIFLPCLTTQKISFVLKPTEWLLEQLKAEAEQKGSSLPSAQDMD
jgi:hypothetical protein